MKRSTAIALGATALATVLGVVAGAGLVAPSHAAPGSLAATARPGLELHVPRASGPVVLDGELDDGAWLRQSARTNAFVTSDGTPAHPYSDARLVWGDGQLYVALYAADEDIESTRADADGPLWLQDSFHLAFDDGSKERALDVSPLGVVTDGRRTGQGPFDYAWQSGARVGHDTDGTPNDPTDDDEEWVIEMAIPLESLGLHGTPGARIGFGVHRCDTPRGAARVCASWGEGAERGVLVLD